MGPALSTDALVDLLASPDPEQRDDVAYRQLVDRVSTGQEDGRLAALGDRGAALLGHDEVQARTFGALVLAEATGRDAATAELAAPTVHRWQETLCRWYLAEEDLRGWDPALGWLHAVAHGADAVGAIGRSRHTTAERLASLLAVARDRVLTTGDAALFANAEEDRLGFAVALVLTRPELSAHEATGWLEPVERSFAAGEPGPVPAWVSNTARTLRSLYVFVDRGVTTPEDGTTPLAVPHRRAVLDALAATLRATFPLLG